MHEAKLKKMMQDTLSKGLLLDLVDAISARALSAHTMIRDHAELDPRRSRQVEGRVRFPMQEQSFQKVCLAYGGYELTTDVLPGTNLKVYQPFMRFAADASKNGVVLGFAAMPDPSTLPSKNLSRGAAASLNYFVQDRLDLDGKGSKLGDVFALFLAARDRQQAGMVKEIAVAVVDSSYEEFLFYEDVETFVSSYSDVPPPETEKEPDLGLKLRKSPKPFEAPEKKIDPEEETKKK